MGPPSTLPDLLRDAVVAGPDRVAIAVDGGGRLTYRAWGERSDAVAAGLQRQGVAPGDRVALVFDTARWCDYAVVYLAVHKLGAAAACLTAGGGALPLARALREHEPSAVVAPLDLVPALAAPTLLRPGALEADGRGRPLVRTPERAAADEVLAAVRPLAQPVVVARSAEEVLASPPWAGDAGGPASLLHTLAPGTLLGQDALRVALSPHPTGSIVLPAFDAERLCFLLTGSSIRACALTPATAHALLAAGPTGGHDLSGVDQVLLTAGRTSPSLLTALARAFPRATLAGVDVLGSPAPRTVLVHDRRRPGAVGPAAGDAPVWIADETGAAAGAGTVGVVHIGTAAGPVAAAGNATLGFLDADGFLYVVAGAHEVVRRRGSSVAKAELRSVLGEHPAVVDSAVLGIPEDRSATTLAAAVVLRRPVPESELRAWIGDRLGDDRVPDVVVVVDALPRTAAGAVASAALRHHPGLAGPAATPDAEPASAAERASDAEPTAVMKAVTATWRRVLAMREVALDDDFFSLGGTPLSAATMLDLVEDACGIRLPLSTFLDAPTISGVTAELARRSASATGTGPAPVAFSQEGMIWHEHFVPGCQNLPGLARRYRGPLDVRALDRALDEIVRRHEPLRSTFELRGGRLVQTVRPHRRMPLPVHDLGGSTPDERDEEVARRIAAAGRRPFDLTNDPVFAATLLRLAEDDHVLVIRTHHSVFDDWSVGVLRRELAALYTAFTAGEASPLPEPLRFTDFARAQRRDLAGRAGTREMAFWRRELDGAPFTAQLPVDDPVAAPGSPQTAGQPVTLSLPPDLHAGLRSLAREQRATVFMTMLAAYTVMVHRYTGQEDLLLATVVANRNRTELEGMIGCFTKKVPLRLRLDGDPTFADALTRTRTALLGALTHQDLPFEAVVQDVLGAPAAAHGLVPHVVLMFQGETPRRALDLPGLDTTGFQTSTTARRAHFMADDEQPSADGAAEPVWGAGLYLGTFVILSVAESDDALSCVARGAFHGPAVRQLLDTYQTLLTDVVADPTRPIAELRLLDEPGRDQALARGRGPAGHEPATTLHAAFAERVRSDPDAVAIRDAGRTTTFREVGVRAEQLAGRLRTVGVGPGTTVGLALAPSPDAVVAAFAVWQAGAAWIGLDPEDDGDRPARILAQAPTGVVVGVDPHGTLGRHARVVSVADDRPASTDGAESGVPVPVGAEATAVVHYGAGSGGGARGVVLDHRCLLAMSTGLRDLRGGPAVRNVCLSAAPGEEGFVRQVTALLEGHSLVVPDRPLAADPAATVALVGAGQADVLDCGLADLAGLLDAGLREALARREPEAVELVLVVGTRRALDPQAWAGLRGLDGARPVVLYSAAEVAFAATAGAVADTARPVVGRPLAGMEAHVLDSRGCPVPPRVRGELHLGGANLAAGHRKGEHDGPQGDQPFVDRVLAGAATRLYRTGHLARRLPDGTVELLGPLEADTDLRGFTVDPARVQSALAGCPGIRDVTVTLHRDDSGDARLVAHVRPDGQPPTVATLRTAVWARLPGYACPSAMVVLGDAGGDAAAAGDAPGGHPGPAHGGGAAETAVLTALWADVLGAGHVGAGGNYWQRFSFLEVLARAREAGLAVAGERVTRHRTVEMLAADVASRPPRSP